ncbi:hypothetical protein BG015_004452 [Linnemannia schmuckeri]|uniref:Uncharacterized protein n=1 Tax=Linnemannia schmuckeri TaxID=64567 RepID=A0A9P5VFJ2_9FUNG|nr:hypothetical protein BG015_004452 [Linnemannia schmuckeri]
MDPFQTWMGNSTNERLDAELHLVHRYPTDQSLVVIDASADSIEFADGDDEDQEYDDEQDNEEGREGDEEDDDAAEYNAEDETDFSSQDFGAEPVGDNEDDENQVDVNMNMNIAETDTNNQDNQDTSIATDDAVLTAATAEKYKLPPTVDDIICTGVPLIDEEATYVDLPLKLIDNPAPPCSEHAAWNVMYEPFPIGLEQFRALVELQGYNARQINEDPQAKRELLA